MQSRTELKHTSRADTETIIKDAEDYEDVATTEKIICVSIVSVKVATSTAQCTEPDLISYFMAHHLLGLRTPMMAGTRPVNPKAPASVPDSFG